MCASLILMKAVSPVVPISGCHLGKWMEQKLIELIGAFLKLGEKKESFQELYKPCIDLCPRCGEFIRYLLLLDDQVTILLAMEILVPIQCFWILSYS